MVLFLSLKPIIFGNFNNFWKRKKLTIFTQSKSFAIVRVESLQSSPINKVTRIVHGNFPPVYIGAVTPFSRVQLPNSSNEKFSKLVRYLRAVRASFARGEDGEDDDCRCWPWASSLIPVCVAFETCRAETRCGYVYTHHATIVRCIYHACVERERERRGGKK